MGLQTFNNMEENIMALGFQQNRPVTAFTFDIATLTGKVATAAAFVDTLDTATDGTYTNLATTTDGSGVGATFDVVITGNAVDTVTLNTVGAGYVVGDTLVIDFSLITGASSGTVASTVATVVGEVATVDTVAGGLGWVVGDTVQASELSTDGSGSGLTLTVATASAVTQVDPPLGGVPSAFTVTAGGTGYAVNDSQEYIGTGEKGLDDIRYSDHDQYELGGAQREYTDADGVAKSTYTPNTDSATLGVGTNVGDPSNALDTGTRFNDNLPTTKTVLKADLPQWKVQQRDIDGGTVTVFAEPGVVDRNGYLVGQDLRAEDMTDQARCEANGFVWGTVATGDADQGSYGACRELIATDFDGIDFTATEDADCPVGSKWDGVTGCVAYTAVEVNALTQSSTQVLRNECIASGNHWEEKASSGATVAYTVGTSVASAGSISGGSGYSVGDVVTVIGDTGVTFTITEVTAYNTTNNSGGAVISGTLTGTVSILADGAKTGTVTGTKCIDASTPGNFSLVNFNYPTQSGAVDYAKTTCLQYGHRWNPVARTCIADNDHTGLGQTACIAAGHVYIAGVCYDGADFGDGQNRSGSFQQFPTYNPK